MEGRPLPYYESWIVTHGDPPGKPRMLERPRRAVVTTQTYSGRTVTDQVYVIATAPGWVCVQQDFRDRAPWNAWIPAREAMPA